MAFIIKPLVTEKMTTITDKRPNRYGFIVERSATKTQIKHDVEAIYGVKVVRVNTMVQRGKDASRYTKAGMIEGQKPTLKKATVFLAKDDKIDFYSNI